MDSLHQQQQQEAMEVTPQDSTPVNREERAFKKCLPQLKLGLESTIESIAQRCRAKGLINDKVYGDILNGQWKPEQSRAQYFVRCIYTRLSNLEELGQQEKVKKCIKTLSDIVGRDSALKHTAKLIGKLKDNYNKIDINYNYNSTLPKCS